MAKKYYKKNYYHKKKEEKKVLNHETLFRAQVNDADTLNTNIDKMQVIKYIAVSAVLFAIIIGSLLLFRQM